MEIPSITRIASLVSSIIFSHYWVLKLKFLKLHLVKLQLNKLRLFLTHYSNASFDWEVSSYIWSREAWNERYLSACIGTLQVNISTLFQRPIWRRDVGQRQINVETTLCKSMLKLTTLNNVESTLSISTLILTTLDNVEKALRFSTSNFTTLTNTKAVLQIWPFA